MLTPYQVGGVVGPTGRPLKQTVLRNAARCDGCGDVVESTHHHDFRSCSCGAVFVDGGHDYIRRGFTGPYTDLSVTKLEEMTNEEIAEVHSWGFGVTGYLW